MASPISWFEIPSVDFDRAVAFYEALFGVQLVRMGVGDTQIAYFPAERGEPSGHINPPEASNTPADHGPILYLDAEGRMDSLLARVSELGGKVVVPKTHIGDPGYIALFLDTEGNRLGMHSSVG